MPAYPWPNRARALVAALVMLMPAPSLTATSTAHPITIDDVLDTVALDGVAVSPDGQMVAAVVQRPPHKGEVFGRNAYEIDPGRNDVWLISRRTGERRNLTQGRTDAAGYWCASWSPDGRHLAMLSTQPEGAEPRGGDNVRLYVWTVGDQAPHRLSAAAVLTQSRYGSPINALDLRGGADGGAIAHICSAHQENAPFLWLDEHRILAVTLPPGAISAAIDAYGRPFREAASTARALAAGETSTATAVGSGAERIDTAPYHAILRVLDIANGHAETIARVPAYPFQGALTISIAPDRRTAAILAPVDAIHPEGNQPIPWHDDQWLADKRLGFVSLEAGSPVHWVSLPGAARYPVELLDWAPDGRSVALRARGAFAAKATGLFVVSVDTRVAGPHGLPLTIGTGEAGPDVHEPSAFWIDNQDLLVRGGPENGADERWWCVRPDRIEPLAAAPAAQPATFRRTATGDLVGLAGTRLARIDGPACRLVMLGGSAMPAGSTIVWPQDPHQPSGMLVTQGPSRGRKDLRLVRFSETGVNNIAPLSLPAKAELIDIGHGPIWREPTARGLFLRQRRARQEGPSELLALDTHLASVRWGRTLIVDYAAASGKPLKAAVILPPDYRMGSRHPVITWVYGGYEVQGPDDYWLDPFLPGFYNLQLYAARGYIVLVPSMPLDPAKPGRDSYAALPGGVLPAIEKLVALGLADPDRVGLMGQSFGGYSVYGLLAQSKRFRAGVAIAGLSDLGAFYGAFDPAARGYPGIEHQKSDNWSIAEKALGFGEPPFAAAGLYARNSPLTYAAAIETPLLLIHGELDGRGSMAQAEALFFSLYRQGKTARLLRYWGESHSLAQSPANVRDVFQNTLAWFDTYMASGMNSGRLNAAGEPDLP